MRVTLKKAACVFLCTAICFSILPGQAFGAGPGVSAQAAVLMDRSSGRILYEKNGTEELPIASITKVMTAVLAIESGKMNQMVTISDQAIKAGGSSIYLKPGEKIRLADLVYGLMLRSGNDAAVAIAEAVAQSEAGFVFLMNEKARLLGMTDTHFTNSNGLDNPDHYSTADDMAILTQYAMSHALFRKIVQTKVYKASATNKEGVRLWRNKNKMLTQYPFSTGGKTGFTRTAGRTLISTASKNQLDLIAVTLNDGNDWLDHKNLFEWAFSVYQQTEVVRKGKFEANADPFYRGHLYASRSLFLPLTKDEQRSFTKKLILIRPPVQNKNWTPPSPAGRVVILLGNREIAEVPLFYEKAKEKTKGLWPLFADFFKAEFTGSELP
ncbi:D-alanyl-D-alanine carboxypeptidase family protein [Sporolactobacillus putidus]|nr:D-alanyl-D-alanine carboxypeptidase family protein [Sporolactobacillus putidus]